MGYVWSGLLILFAVFMCFSGIFAILFGFFMRAEEIRKLRVGLPHIRSRRFWAAFFLSPIFLPVLAGVFYFMACRGSTSLPGLFGTFGATFLFGAASAAFWLTLLRPDLPPLAGKKYFAINLIMVPLVLFGSGFVLSAVSRGQERFIEEPKHQQQLIQIAYRAIQASNAGKNRHEVEAEVQGELANLFRGPTDGLRVSVYAAEESSWMEIGTGSIRSIRVYLTPQDHRRAEGRKISDQIDLVWNLRP